MNRNISFYFAIALMIGVICNACTKEPHCEKCIDIKKPPLLTTVTNQATVCNNRAQINVRLQPIGSLSQPRFGLVTGSAGSKILFAGGWTTGSHSTRVDIYDTLTHAWTTSELTVAERDGMAIGSVGSKVFFAGGGNNDWIDVTSRIDVYDAASDCWSTAELSVPRKYLTAATVGNKILFAGGGVWGPLPGGSQFNYLVGTDVVDIYDNATNKWSTAALSEGRYELSSAGIDNKLYFGGGLHSMFTASNTIDIYDAITNTWSTSQLQEAKASPACIAAGNKIFWGAGATTSYQSGYRLSKLVEINDVVTNTTTVDCMIPKAMFQAVKKNEYVIFFTGYNQGPGNGLDIYNMSTNKWLNGVLPFDVFGAAIIAVNNRVYVAGGKVNGVYSNQVWELDF